MNSKKCLIPSLFFLLLPALSWASSESFTRQLTQEIQKTKPNASFESLFNRWESNHPRDLFQTLAEIAQNRALSDQHRYIALMGSVRFGGQGATPLLLPLLKDRSWIIRSGTIRALCAIQDKRSSPEIMKLIRDPALVVRMEALDGLAKLNPAGMANVLVDALSDPRNYHHGKSQWIPDRAVDLLVALMKKSNDKPTLARLLKTLPRIPDLNIRKRIIESGLTQ